MKCTTMIRTGVIAAVLCAQAAHGAGQRMEVPVTSFKFSGQGQYVWKQDRRDLFQIIHPWTTSKAGDFGQMEADVAVEQQRSQLVDCRVQNERKEAESRGQALRATLEPLKDVDWRTLMAASSGGINPKLLVAMAFRDLADNAGKIGQLNISPDLLNALLTTDGKQ